MLKLNKDTKREFKRDIYGIMLIAGALLLLVCLIRGETAGLIGGFIARFINFIVGTSCRWFVPSIIFVIGVLFLVNVQLTHLKSRAVGLILSSFSIISFSHIMLLKNYDLTHALSTGLAGQGGGLLGGLFVLLLNKAFGQLGMQVILYTMATVGLLMLTRLPIFLYFVAFGRWMKEKITLLWHRKTQQQTSVATEIKVDNKETMLDKTLSSLEQEFVIEAVELKEDIPEEIASQVLEPQDEEDENAQFIQLNVTDQNLKEYRFPSLELLTSKVSSQHYQEKDIKMQAKKIEETLQNFNIVANVMKVSVGPTITRYELQIAAGIKVSRVTALADDIALSLAAQGIRIEAPIPGKSAIGIEVPNEENSIVYFKDVLQDERYQKSKKALTIALGLGISGQTVVTDLAKMPHVLIAGATGSGKSVCINVIINSILYKATPEQVKFLLIDPKRVELSVYNGMPHLLAPVVTDPKKAATALRWVIEEMDKRYKSFAEKGARDLERYNQLVCEEDHAEQLNPLPLIVVIIDELADLMMVASGDVEDAICRLAQMGRAAGIHLVIGTQRPSVDVITGLIKANIPARIAFAVSSGIDSRTILDMIGAEKLLGKGDMLFAPQGLNKPVRIQGAYISDEEVERVVDFIARQRIVEYEQKDFKVKTPESENISELDPLFADAVRLILEQGNASISMLQRRFRIGYTRAARIIDQMEMQGIVGGYEGSKARKVYADSPAVLNILSEQEQKK